MSQQLMHQQPNNNKITSHIQINESLHLCLWEEGGGGGRRIISLVKGSIYNCEKTLKPVLGSYK